MSRAAALVLIATAGLLLAACESTQDKSRRLASQGGQVFQEAERFQVGRTTSSVEVVKTHTVQDENGVAVVVDLENATKAPLGNLPISIDVKDAAGASIYKNDEPGIEESLVRTTYIGPEAKTSWVNDQIAANGEPASVDVRVGAPEVAPPAGPIELKVTGMRYRRDPVDGLQAVGKVRNDSKIEQRKLVLFGISRKGGKVVAAGSAQLRRVKAGGKANFMMFFIGNPRKGRLEITAPPTVFE